jgi:tRNA(Ile)-lysidine synthase
MSLLSSFTSTVKSNNLFTPTDKLLLAVSGGADSVVLCELCKQAGYNFIIAHCNFQLRGEESERDELFVKNLGVKYDVQVLVKKFDTEQYAAENKISIQEAARDLRYSWFKELLTQNLQTGNDRSPTPDSRLQTPGYLLTAHHADDNIETLLMNFCRGTGLHGLTGIPVSISGIRRPLLDFSKDQLLKFALENKLEYVEDSSNQSSKYTRNFFRHEIIPAISKVYPQVKENLQDNINRFKEIEKLYQFSVGDIRKKLCRQKGEEVHIPVKQLMGFNNRALIYEIISPYGFAEKQVDEVVKLATSESGKFISSPGNNYRIIKHRHWFIISPVRSIDVTTIAIEQTDKHILFPEGELYMETIQTTNYQLPTTNSVGCLDTSDISFPLLLRKWKTGDYFYPLGMKKKKKVSRFLIDQKLSKTAKEGVWVIESNKRILWVIGHRIDDRFKVTGATKTLLLIRFNNSARTRP